MGQGRHGQYTQQPKLDARLADHLYAAALEAALSSQRLLRYRQQGDGPFDHLGRYLWNMSLGEAAYPALHQLEIAFRNSFHGAISSLYGPTWFTDADVLLTEELTKVQEAQQRLVAERKDSTDAGRVVAELTFAFWTGLLSGPHANTAKPLWPHLRERVFPYADIGMRTVTRVASGRSVSVSTASGAFATVSRITSRSGARGGTEGRP